MAELSNDSVEPGPRDELHGEIVESAVFPRFIYGDDIGVVQPSRSTCLTAKSFHPTRVEQGMR
jgi:hypothetical protein